MATIAAKSPLNLAELLEALPAGARVLDLGCGAGTFDYRRYPLLRIRAVDEARPEASDFPPHADFTLGSASSIPEPDGLQDLVVVNFAFEHFPDARASLGEIDRVLRDSGRAWISVPNAASFEDQLYRNLFAGGGHLQRPEFEWFLRQVYRHTSLKLISYIELPAGFTYLGESEGLRHLTWAIVDALRRTAGIDARSRSGYIFVLEKRASAGPGFREHLRTCSFCGSPDGDTERGDVDPRLALAWTCSHCGGRNTYPSAIPLDRKSEIERGMQVQWERYPRTRPERLHEMLEERSRWGKELERLLEEERTRAARLQEEFDARGRWAAELEAEMRCEREQARRFLSELETVRREAAELRAEIGRLPGWLRGTFREAARIRRTYRKQTHS